MKDRPCRFLYTCLWITLFTIMLPLSQAGAQTDFEQDSSSRSTALNGKGGDIIAGQYIVQFSAPPLAVYKGGIAGLPPAGSRGRGNKLDTAHPDSSNYLHYLQGRQADMLRNMEKELGRGIRASHAYRAAYNGVAVRMSEVEARRIARLPGVAAVHPDKMRRLHTDTGPQWIGADVLWTGAGSTATKGAGVVIGVIDTGINPANPSFADIGGDGHVHINPRAQYYGFCDPEHLDYNDLFLCNDKLIGAYDFTRTHPTAPVLYDNHGHGSHTASTAAGNVVNPASISTPTITINRNISGVAPHSSIISYKACKPAGCYLSWLLSAIEQAVIDGVDVINYSIGGFAADPWNDADSEAFLNARQAGIFVAASAGNSGPYANSIGSPANSPWLLSVGNSSHDRNFVNALTGLTSDNASLPDISGRSLTGALPAADIVYAGDCLDPFTPGTFSGQIVVCDRGTIARVEKGSNVLAGGAAGMVLANDAASGSSLVADPHYLPAVHITYTDGETLKNWIAANSSPRAAIAGTRADVHDAYGNIMVSSSSLGANSPAPDIIKPDVSAPGLDILAADGMDNVISWGMMTGTSMASPHAAGAAALLISLHPDWSPAEIQSALMSTADPAVLKANGVTPANPFDTGAGRIDVSRAARAGFVLDETHANYLAADPYWGGDPKTLNIPSLGREDIGFSTSWTRTLTATTNTSWTASVINPAGFSLSVDPASFTLAAGETQQVTITADAGSTAFNTWLFGSVLFTPLDKSVPMAHFPVALKRAPSNIPTSLRYYDVLQTDSATENNLDVRTDITDLTISTNGLIAATLYNADLYQDPTPHIFHDPYPDPEPSEGLWATDGLWIKKVTVPAGTRRLVTEIVASESPDIDLYLYRWTGTGWEWLCTSAYLGSSEYCSITDPVAGDYYVWMHNYEASDPSGTTPDYVELATAVVPEASAGNLTVALAGGGTSIPEGELFALNISWDLTGPIYHWYGRFGLGTDAGNPDNIGLVDLDLHIRTNVISASAGEHGSISPSGAVKVNHGSDQAFTITPNLNHHVVDVLVDGLSVGAVTSYTFTNVTGPHTISATFAINTYTISASSGPNGSISPSGTITVNHGSDISFTFTPGTGYHIADVLVDGISVGPVTSYTFSSVTTNHTIEALFSDTYTIMATAGDNGTIDPFGSVVITPGSDISFIFTPGTGYHVADVLVDGLSVGAVTSYTFSNVNAYHTIEALFSDTYTITAIAGENGIIEPAGFINVYPGDDQAFTIKPNVNHHVADVLVDGLSVGPVTSHTFTDVTGPHTISATFAVDQYTLTIHMAGRKTGTVSSSPAGIDCGTVCSHVYDHGEKVSLTATPTDNARFRGWSGDADCADGTVVMTRNIDCTATFSGFPWIMFNNILSGSGR